MSYAQEFTIPSPFPHDLFREQVTHACNEYEKKRKNESPESATNSFTGEPYKDLFYKNGKKLKLTELIRRMCERARQQGDKIRAGQLKDTGFRIKLGKLMKGGVTDDELEDLQYLIPLVAWFLGKPVDSFLSVSQTLPNKFERTLDIALMSADAESFCKGVLHGATDAMAGLGKLLASVKEAQEGHKLFIRRIRNDKLSTDVKNHFHVSTEVNIDVFRADADYNSAFNDTLAEAAFIAYEHLRYLRKNDSDSESEIGIAVGLGKTVREILEILIPLVASDDSTEARKARKRITFYPIDHTLDITPDDDPSEYYNNIPEIFLPDIFRRNSQWGMTLQIKSLRTHSSNGAHSRVDISKDIHLFITSVSDWRDEHSALKKYLQDRMPAGELTAMKVCGAVQSWPFSETEFLLTEESTASAHSWVV